MRFFSDPYVPVLGQKFRLCIYMGQRKSIFWYKLRDAFLLSHIFPILGEFTLNSLKCIYFLGTGITAINNNNNNNDNNNNNNNNKKIKKNKK